MCEIKFWRQSREENGEGDILPTRIVRTVWKNGLVERSTHVNQMLDDPSCISQGTLCFAYDKLLVKIMASYLFVAFEGVDSEKFNDFLGVEWSLYKLFFTFKRTPVR